MSIIISETTPKEGQCVAIWNVRGKLFSATCDWVGFVLRSYNAHEDCYETEHGMDERFFQSVNATFYQFVE